MQKQRFCVSMICTCIFKELFPSSLFYLRIQKCYSTLKKENENMQYTHTRSPFEHVIQLEVQLKMHAIVYTNLILEIPRESKTIRQLQRLIYICVCVSLETITYFKASQLLVKDCKLRHSWSQSSNGFQCSTPIVKPWPRRSWIERWPRKRKVGRSNPSSDRPKSLKQVMTAPLTNARH